MRTPHVGVLVLMLGWAAATAGGSELTPEEAHGKQIYANGTSPSGAEITAQMGVDGFRLPASAMPCGSCHGPDGRGRPEGGVIPSDVTWSHLTRSYGHQHSYGREHPAFTEETAARAISAGVDPAGNRLDIAMPVYSMAEVDLDALVAYLKRIETDYDPGITPNSMRLATLLPLSGQLATLGNAMRAILQAYVDDLNSAGGVNGRMLELEVIPFGDNPEQALGNLQQALKAHEVFALLAPYSVGIEDELAGFAEQQHVPIIGPYTLQPPVSAALDRYTFYLFSGIEEQMRVLVETVVDQYGGEDPGLVVTGADNDAVRSLAKAATKQAQRHDWQDPATLYYGPAEFDAEALAEQIRASDTGALFFFGTPVELEALLAEFADDDEVPLIVLPANRVARSLFEAPLIFDGRILSAYPRSPSDVTVVGQDAYAALRENHELSGEHASAQLAVLAAAATLGEGLKRAGKELSRESLIKSMESLHQYETGFAPPVSFTLNRRIGALGAHVVRLDLERKTFVPTGPWRNLK